MDIVFSPVTLQVPANKCGESLSLYYVGREERTEDKNALNWHLLTTEPIQSKADALNIIRYYEHRWLVEEYHKAWKFLWIKRVSRTLPDTVPSMKWAYTELARLGGWKDTKQTGKASVKVLWQRLFKLQTILEGYDLAKFLEADL